MPPVAWSTAVMTAPHATCTAANATSRMCDGNALPAARTLLAQLGRHGVPVGDRVHTARLPPGVVRSRQDLNRDSRTWEYGYAETVAAYRHAAALARSSGVLAGMLVLDMHSFPPSATARVLRRVRLVHGAGGSTRCVSVGTVRPVVPWRNRLLWVGADCTGAQSYAAGRSLVDYVNARRARGTARVAEMWVPHPVMNTIIRKAREVGPALARTDGLRALPVYGLLMEYNEAASTDQLRALNDAVARWCAKTFAR